MSERRTSSRLKKKLEEDGEPAAAAPAPAPAKKPRAKKPAETAAAVAAAEEDGAAAAPAPAPAPTPVPVTATAASASPAGPPSPAPAPDLGPAVSAAAAPPEPSVALDEDEVESPPTPQSPAAPMVASQASASQGSMSSVEEAEEKDLTVTMYPVFPGMSSLITERINELLPAFGEKPIPFSTFAPAGVKNPIFLFTVARAKLGVYAGKSYSVEMGDLDKVASIGCVVLYRGRSGVANATFVVLATRLSLLPPGEEGFVPDPYIIFALPKVVGYLRGELDKVSYNGPLILRVPRTQKPGDAEYLGTLGTLASLGFAYSPLNVAGEPVKFKLFDKDDSVEYGALQATPSAGGVESVTYKYALPGQLPYTESFTFSTVESVQVVRPGKMEASQTIEMVADARILGKLTEGEDITIPVAVLRDAETVIPRIRGGRRKTRRQSTYRKTARKGKTTRRR